MSDFDLIEYLRKEEEHFLPEPPEELLERHRGQSADEKSASHRSIVGCAIAERLLALRCSWV